MKFSWTRAIQWVGILAVLVFVVALRYEAPSEAGMQMNASPNSPLSQSLRGYWKMDDGSGTNATDASGNGNTLAMTGSPSWVAGQIGPYSLTFSGSGQYLSIADPASGVLDFPNGTNFSLSGWFNRSAFAADHTIIAKKNDQTTGAGYVVWIDNNGSTDHLFFEASDGTHTYQIQSTTDFSASGWHHFAVTWNDNNSTATNPVNLYIDGKLDNGSTSGTFSSVTDLSNALAFTIGAESDAGVPFAGSLDDIRVYGYTLSADQVKKIYNTTSPTQPIDTSLVGHWTFDGNDIQGTTAIDRSSYGNNGTITGAVPTIGKLGQALSFDGTSDSMDILTKNALPVYQSGTQISVSFWIKASPQGESGDPNIIFTEYHGSFPTFRLFAAANTSPDSLIVRIRDNAGDYILDDVSSNGVVFDDSWHHIVWVDNNGSAELYIDGLRDSADFSYTPTSVSNTDDLYMGDINGDLDDIRVYNRALSSEEVVCLYNL